VQLSLGGFKKTIFRIEERIVNKQVNLFHGQSLKSGAINLHGPVLLQVIAPEPDMYFMRGISHSAVANLFVVLGSTTTRPSVLNTASG
jgi:alpha-D-ribose 1-methylphosphonate 5-triphosphate diphosphatase PhnM